MNRRDIIIIAGIAIVLMAGVSGFEMMLRGVPEASRGIPMQSADPSLSASATPLPERADSTQPAATAVATDRPDQAQPVTPTPSG